MKPKKNLILAGIDRRVAREGAGRRAGTNGGARKPADPPAGGEPVRVVEAIDDPHRLARLYLADHETPAGRGLRWWREEWHLWEGCAYHVFLDKELRADIGRRCKVEFDRLNVEAVRKWVGAGREGPCPAARKVTTRLTGDVAHALTGQVRVSGTTERAAWLDGDGPAAADEILACRNGLVHLPSWAAGQPCTFPPTPKFFTANALPYDFDPDAPGPEEWLRFLARVWGDDRQSTDALQEWFGYMLLPDTSQQKIGMVVGPKRSGKGTIARVLTRLVGPGNVCSPTLASLGMNFGLQPLLGKTVAIVSDARMSGRTDTVVVTERLLSISGEDGLTVDRKHMTSVTGKLPVRFTILTNELPRMSDSSGALVGRLVVLRMTKSWYGKEDTTLTNRLLAELPGILLWAMEGWRRLRDRGRFATPASAARLVEEMEDLASPVGAFVRERCDVGSGYRVTTGDLYKQWRSWCDAKGRDPSNQLVFGRDLRAALPGVEVTQPRIAGIQVRFYEGVRLCQDQEEPPISHQETPF